MNNDPMYNTFVKNRSKDYSKKRVNESDLPDFDFDIDEPAGTPKPKSKPTLNNGGAVGVDHRNLGSFSDYRRPDTGSASSLSEPEFTLFGNEPSKGGSRSAYNEPFEFEDGCVSLPNPEIFNSYPPEVQRKIMEWTDRDIKARRDDESRRQDAVLRAEIARERTKTAVPVAIIVLCIICALIIGLLVKRVAFVVGFLVVAIVVVITTAVQKHQQGKRANQQRPPYPKA